MVKKKRFLIVKLGAIGDVVHALPVLATLKNAYPHSHVAWIVEKKAAPLLQGNPLIDDLLIIDSKRWRKNPSFGTCKEIMELFRYLRAESYDYAFDIQGLMKSGVITWLSGAKTTVGFSAGHRREALNGLFTKKKIAPTAEEVHVVEICLSLLRALPVEKNLFRFPLFIPDDDVRFVKDFFEEKGLKGNRPSVLINPGAAWRTKEWGVENYGLLGKKIRESFPCHIVITWGPGEEEMALEVQEIMEGGVMAPPTTIKQSLALIKEGSLFIGADTGPLHIAAALGVPTIALFGPSTPARNRPYGDLHRIVYKNPACGDCYKRSCATMECMKNIEVEEVYREVADFFEKRLEKE